MTSTRTCWWSTPDAHEGLVPTATRHSFDRALQPTHMEWKLFADLAEVAGTDRPTVDEDAATVGEALDALLADRPDLTDRVREEDGGVSEHVNVLVNGTDVTATDEGLARPIEDGDELALFPPVSGG